MAKTDQNTTKIKSKATKPKAGVDVVKKPLAKTERKRKITRDQRNADGTFKKGNAGGGRKPMCMSARAQARLMVENNPELLENALSNLFRIAADKSDNQSVAATDKIIKLLGNYDPQETKDVTPKEVPEDPLFNLTVEELRTLKALKKGKK